MDSLKFNYVMQCEYCTVRDKCKLGKDNSHYCDYELNLIESIKNFILGYYKVEERDIEMPLVLLIRNEILAMRIHRELKFKGMTKEVEIPTPDGSIFREEENVLKQGLHLDENRIIRLLREMKLTPREREPAIRKMEIKQIVMQVSKKLDEQEKLYTVDGQPIIIKKKEEEIDG